MTRCLGERVLWDLREGEGQAAERAHVASCLRCAGRSQRLARDLADIEGTLKAGPIVMPCRRTRRPGRLVAGAAVVVMALAGGTATREWWGPLIPPARRPLATPLETLAWLDDVSAVLSGTGDEMSPVAPISASLPRPGDAGAISEEPWAD